MKRLVAIALALTMLLSGVALAQEQEASAITVASLTPMSGMFFTDMWGNNTADVDVRTLLDGYATVEYTQDGAYAIDNVAVEECTSSTGAAGKTYTFRINQGLTYNDGTPIKANDYVFAILLRANPAIAEIGGLTDTMGHFVGFEEFQNGAPFSGVRLVDEYTFTVTIKNSVLPYFYELALVRISPAPMGVIAPECTVADDGNGAYIKGDFTAELLNQTLMNSETGYLSHPMVTAGPYQLESYDAVANVAVFSINPQYLGTGNGQKPSIERITFGCVAADALLDEVEAGRIDLVNKTMQMEIMDGAAKLKADGKINMTVYPRAGLNFLAFSCEQDVTGNAALRQAVEYSIDRDALCSLVADGYTMPVYGYYGLGQWMTGVDYDRLLETVGTSAYELAAAIKLLEADGWTLNDKGEAYRLNTDAIRYKRIDGVLTRCELRWAKAEANAIGDIVKQMLEENLPQIGIALEVTEMPFDQMLDLYYRAKDRSMYNMFQLGSNFNQLFDPYWTFNTQDSLQGVMNTSGLKDEKLMQLADDMRKTESGEVDAYYEHWLDFQKYFAEVTPIIPLFTGVYADIYCNKLDNYQPETLWSWASAIVYAELSDGEDGDIWQIIP